MLGWRAFFGIPTAPNIYGTVIAEFWLIDRKSQPLIAAAIPSRPNEIGRH
jgi:hypothetical protein